MVSESPLLANLWSSASPKPEGKESLTVQVEDAGNWIVLMQFSCFLATYPANVYSTTLAENLWVEEPVDLVN
eukprot:378663-Amphidinium_carterae.1